MNRLYIAMLRADAFCEQEDWPDGVAVYYDPGAISLASGETLSYCFLERLSVGGLTVCSGQHSSLDDHLVNHAVNPLDQERRRVDGNLPADWPDGVHQQMEHWAAMLYRLHYFEPEHRYVTAMLDIVRAGRVLSQRQMSVIEQIYRERGDVEGLRRRHHAQWRLMRLSELDLPARDREAVERLQRAAGRSAGLSQQQLAVIGALEQKYWQQRQEATEQRATLIAAALRR